jgi:hypothetical protein
MTRFSERGGLRKAPPCPCCGGTMHNDPERNCRSRFADVMVCVACGTREATLGRFFWEDIYFLNSLSIHVAQRKWRKIG